MLFHEIYGSYYRVTASVLREAARGSLTRKGLTDLIRAQAFSESLLTIPEGLQGERWRLLRRDLTTPVQSVPDPPLTLLQRRWLKAVLLDERIRLFDPDPAGLEDVEPLFTPDRLVYFDRYADSDPYADPAYIARFKTVLKALREGQNLFVNYRTARGESVSAYLTPHHLEYSEKDDRFRLVSAAPRRCMILNLSRLTRAEPAPRLVSVPLTPPQMAQITFELVDERNTLERVLLHFSHLQKETERLDDAHYRVTLYYDRRDETEMLIRILSFGPTLRVISPEPFIALLRQRINLQKPSP